MSIKLITAYGLQGDTAETLVLYDGIIRFVLSGISNLTLFLTLVIIPKDFGEKPKWKDVFNDEKVKIGIPVILLCSICAALAKWAFEKSENFNLVGTGLEIPDHIISSVILIWFAVVLFRELAFRRSRVFAWGASILIITYAGLFIFHIVNIFNLYSENAWGIPPGRASAGVTLVSFFLKAGLFFPTYYLITSVSNEFGGIQQLLKQVTNNRVEFLESEGILKKIVEILKADNINLTIMLPGKTRRLVSIYQFPPSPEYTADPQKKPKIIFRNIKPARADEGEIYEQVFKNQLVTYNVHNYNNNLNETLIGKIIAHSKSRNSISLIAAPIKYHGAVIGCLEIYLDKDSSKLAFSRTDVLQIQRIAVLLSRTIQANRETAGLDQLISRIGSLQTDQHELSPDEALNKILEVLDDLFSPLELGINTDIGFKAHSYIYSQNAEHRAAMEENLKEDIPNKINGVNVTPVFNNLIVPSFKNFRKLSNVKDVEESVKTRTFGKIIAYIPPDNDKYDAPTLFNYHLYCRVISTIVADAFLDFARDYFNHHLKDLTVNLNSTNNKNLATWFEIVKNKIIEAGLLWAVVSKEDHPNDLLGKNKGFVKELIETRKPDYEGEVISIYDINNYKESPLNRPLSEKDITSIVDENIETNHVIRLELKGFGGWLWLGIERETFGSEIKIYETSPWKTFLERLAEISDSSLYKITEREFHELATVAVTFATLTHQIKNQVGEFLSPISTLEDDLYLGRLKGTAEAWERIQGLKSSAEQVREVATMLVGNVDVDSHSPCTMEEIIGDSKKYLANDLLRKSVNLQNNLTSEESALKINIPFYVGSFAFTNLISNAIYAISNAGQTDGEISISIKEMDESVLCYVKDNGPGIRSSLIDVLFDKGKSFRESKGSGWGLYLTKRSLIENGATIKLTSSKDPTIFEIRLPKSV
jgi:signal transduction histidine kinase